MIVDERFSWKKKSLDELLSKLDELTLNRIVEQDDCLLIMVEKNKFTVYANLYEKRAWYCYEESSFVGLTKKERDFVSFIKEEYNHDFPLWFTISGGILGFGALSACLAFF